MNSNDEVICIKLRFAGFGVGIGNGKSCSTLSPSGANVGTNWPDTGLFFCSETVNRFLATSSLSPDLVGLLPFWLCTELVFFSEKLSRFSVISSFFFICSGTPAAVCAFAGMPVAECTFAGTPVAVCALQQLLRL